MSTLRTVIFVDGQNFKKNLQSFEFKLPTAMPDDRPYRLDEKHFIWRLFFQDVIKKFNQFTGFEHRLIRVYWYNADSITPFPKKPYDRLFNKLNKKELLQQYTKQQIFDALHEWHQKERENFNVAKEQVYETIQRDTDFLEFKFVGQFVLRPFEVRTVNVLNGKLVLQGTRAGEKGVDIGIAVDMISKMNDYDTAILVSGDSDFTPAVRYLKDHLKYVYQFSVAKGVPPNIDYLSAWLKSIVDAFQYFDEAELLTTYLTKGDIIPSSVRQLIAQRIETLKGNSHVA
jgi:uncharacterized LabA/DUF88 family protein